MTVRGHQEDIHIRSLDSIYNKEFGFNLKFPKRLALYRSDLDFKIVLGFKPGIGIETGIGLEIGSRACKLLRQNKMKTVSKC